MGGGGDMEIFLMAAALGAALAVWCEERAAGRHRAFYLLKPATTLLILGAVLTAPGADPDYRLWVAVAVLLSTCGDIALMRHDDAGFLVGLGSFLLAHGVFVAAFLLDGVQAPPGWTAVPVTAGLVFLLWLLPRTGRLRPPVAVYAAALVAMSVAAAVRMEIRDDRGAMLAAIGTLVFLLSDAALAIRRFHRPYPHAQAVILSTYWSALGLIALSVAGGTALAPA